MKLLRDNPCVRFCLLLLSALILASDTSAFCNYDQFECDNGRCIPESWQCDTGNDCWDWSDEQDCNCYNEFECANTLCTSWSNRCDGYNDCLDWSDEWSCSNPTTTTEASTCPGEYQCSYSGSCISNSFLCDGDDDCLLGDDESDYQCSLTTQYSNGLRGTGGFNYVGVIAGVSSIVVIGVIVTIVIGVVKASKTTARRAGPAVGVAVTTTSNGTHHQPPPGGPAMQPNQPGFGAPQAYPNGYSAHPGGYPMTGMGPHPGAQPGPYGAPPGVNPSPYPGVQLHQPQMAAGYQGMQAPQQQPPMATSHPGSQAPQHNQHPPAETVEPDTSIPEDDRLYAANQAQSIQPVTTAEVRHVQPAPDTQ